MEMHLLGGKIMKKLKERKIKRKIKIKKGIEKMYTSRK
jgi:hypothetical protein